MLSDPRILHTGESEDARAWKRALAELTLPEPIKAEAGPKRVSAVYRVTLLGSQVALKLDAPLGARAWLARLGLDRSRAARQWEGARVLRAAGVETARPFVLARCTWTHDGVPRRAELVAVEWIEGRTLLEAIAGARGEDRRAIARRAGRLTARLTAGMILNRDHKPSNVIVVTPEHNRAPELALIDTVGIRPGVLPDRASRRMLRDLMLEPTGVGHPPTPRDITGFLKGLEAGGFWPSRGVPDSQAARQQIRALRRELVRSVRQAIAEHGDPTPKVNPLG